MQPRPNSRKFRSAAAFTLSVLAFGGAAYGQNLLISLDTSARSSTVAEPAGYRGSSGSEGPSVSSHGGAASEETAPATTHHGHHEAAAEESQQGHAVSGGGSHAAHEEGGAWVGSKGGMPSAPVAEKPQLVLSAEGGYQSKYIWRGVDLVQFTSYNAFYNALNPGAKISSPQGDVYFLGMSATYNGWAFGVKYIESLSHDFNPFFAPLLSTRDAYSEYIFSVNYTYALLPDRWLNATAGFDFYYYPNGEFWGVDHQGLAYLRFVTPHYQWAQPFLNVFYNVPTTSHGNGLAASNGGGFRQALDGSNVTGSRLVEGWGAELGAAGGSEVARTGSVGYGLSYSLSTTYKSGYAYEPNGFSHITASLSAPVSIGQSLTIAPSVNYVHALKTINSPGAGTWNYPGWWWGVKASFTF